MLLSNMLSFVIVCVSAMRHPANDARMIPGSPPSVNSFAEVAGPVRNLNCDYTFMEDEPLRCTWLPPNNFHGSLTNYSIQVKSNGTILHSDFTTGTNYKTDPDFTARKGSIYEVVVSALTTQEGLPTSTTLKFTYSGPSPVRNLQCEIDRQNNDKLICTWTEPEHLNGPIQMYRVYLTKRPNSIIVNDMPKNRFEWNQMLEHGEIYTIVVNAKTDKWSNSASTTFQYISSKSPGPVENLTCIYVFVEDEPLRCTWNAPSNLTDTIRIYNVEVKYNDQVLHSGTTAGTSYKKTPEFRAYPKYVYEVTVTAMTDIIGSPTSTSLKFLHSGPSLVRDIHCYFDTNENDQLICTWTEPEYKNGPVQLYSAHLMANERTIHMVETKDNQFKWKHPFEYDEIYSLNVKAKTTKWGESSSTTFTREKPSQIGGNDEWSDINKLGWNGKKKRRGDLADIDVELPPFHLIDSWPDDRERANIITAATSAASDSQTLSTFINTISVSSESDFASTLSTLTTLPPAPGPVRNLQCSYDRLRELAFSCEWIEPEQAYAPINFYNVNISHNGVLIEQTSTKSSTLQKNSKLTQGEIYTVTVSAMAHVEGAAVGTRVSFTNSGKFKVHAVGSDVIGVKWDAKALLRSGIADIFLIAEPTTKSLPIANVSVKSASGKANITTNLRPSSKYVIHVKDKENTGQSDFTYTIGVTTTMPPAPGPVRDLRCSYDALRKQILLCEWSEPEETYAPIRYYQMKIIDDGYLVFNMTTKALKLQTKCLLPQGPIFKVSMWAVTHMEGAVAETVLIFKNSGKFELKKVGTDVISVSWNPDALDKAGVTDIELVAEPINESAPSSQMIVNAASGEASLTENIRPSTTYEVYVEDEGNSGFTYSLGETTTMQFTQITDLQATVIASKKTEEEDKDVRSIVFEQNIKLPQINQTHLIKTSFPDPNEDEETSPDYVVLLPDVRELHSTESHKQSQEAIAFAGIIGGGVAALCPIILVAIYLLKRRGLHGLSV